MIIQKGSNLERDKDGDFWRPGPTEGFEFYEVLPKFINKAKDFLTEAKKNGIRFFVFATCCTPHPLGSKIKL